MGCMFSQLAAKFAFFPPSPPTYQIRKGENGKLSVVSSSSSLPLPASDDSSLDVLLIDTKRGNKIVGFFLRNPYARLTVLYSHGNAADLGQLYDLFVQLKVNLRVNLMGYDYSGYGASTGKPSEHDTYADIEAVYECLQTEYGVSQEDLILYGQSVGSGPTLHLASKLPRLRGVVLHSGILSGLRVLCHVKFSFCLDIYSNINKIKKVKCPVLVIHGTEDDVVNWLHGNGLWKMAREPYEPLWIKGGGHCNLEIYPDYIRHLYRFIEDMENTNTRTRLQKIKQNLGLPNRSSDNDRTVVSARCCGVNCWRPKCPECLKRPKCHKPSCFKCPPCLSPCCGGLSSCCGGLSSCCGGLSSCCGGLSSCCGGLSSCCGGLSSCCGGLSSCCGGLSSCCGCLSSCSGCQNCRRPSCSKCKKPKSCCSCCCCFTWCSKWLCCGGMPHGCCRTFSNPKSCYCFPCCKWHCCGGGGGESCGGCCKWRCCGCGCAGRGGGSGEDEKVSVVVNGKCEEGREGGESCSGFV